MIQIDEHIIQTGWNHQLENVVFSVQACSKHKASTKWNMSTIAMFLPVVPHEAVSEVSKGKVHINQKKNVPIRIVYDMLEHFDFFRYFASKLSPEQVHCNWGLKPTDTENEHFREVSGSNTRRIETIVLNMVHFISSH